MNGCRANLGPCTGLDLRPVRYGVAEPFLMCAGCRATPLGREGTIVERRVLRQQVARERRWVPGWRRNVAAKDMTGRLVA